MTELKSIGWNSWFENHFKENNIPDSFPARIIIEYTDQYQINIGSKILKAVVTGKLLHSSDESGLPKVGDWVVATTADENLAVIHSILPRKTVLSRKQAGKKIQEQVIAANLDVIFIVMGLDKDFNIRRLERYITAVTQTGAKPVVVLNKTDICETTKEKISSIKEIYKDTPVHATSAIDEIGISELLKEIKFGETAIFVGSSGVGKSTIINKLHGYEIQKVQEVRGADSKGRHTTRTKTLFLLEGNKCLIDTPGMRELQLWEESSSLEGSFPEILELAKQCKFKDCSHVVEKDCAVKKAIEGGKLPEERFQSYLKLQKELEFLATKADKRKFLEKKEKTKKFYKMIKETPNRRKF